MSEEFVLGKANAVVLVGEENFGVWRFQIQTILDGLDVFEVVDGSIRKPDPDSSNYQAALTNYMKKDNRSLCNHGRPYPTLKNLYLQLQTP